MLNLVRMLTYSPKKTLKNGENGWLRVKLIIQGRCSPQSHHIFISWTSESDSPHWKTFYIIIWYYLISILPTSTIFCKPLTDIGSNEATLLCNYARYQDFLLLNSYLWKKSFSCALVHFQSLRDEGIGKKLRSNEKKH